MFDNFDWINFLTNWLVYLGPTLVGILTVPLYSLVKKYLTWLNSRPPWLQQIIVVIVAVLLTSIGTAFDVNLPENLRLFSENDINSLISAAMAYGIHAGKKHSENKK